MHECFVVVCAGDFYTFAWIKSQIKLTRKHFRVAFESARFAGFGKWFTLNCSLESALHLIQAAKVLLQS